MHVVNTEYFGKVLIPMDTENTLQDATDQFIYVKLEAQGKYKYSQFFIINMKRGMLWFIKSDFFSLIVHSVVHCK